MNDNGPKLAKNLAASRPPPPAHDGLTLNRLAAYKDFLTLWKEADPDIH
jgi:hypothetical protein